MEDRKKPGLLTQEQIDENCLKRAEEVRAKVRKLEISSLVTQETMHLIFHPPHLCRGNY